MRKLPSFRKPLHGCSESQLHMSILTLAPPLLPGVFSSLVLARYFFSPPHRSFLPLFLPPFKSEASRRGLSHRHRTHHLLFSPSPAAGVPPSWHPGHCKNSQEKHSRIKSREWKFANTHRSCPLPSSYRLPCCPHSPGFSKSFTSALVAMAVSPPRGLPQSIILNSATEPAGQTQRQEKEESQTGRLRKDGIFNSTWAGKSQTTTITLGMSCLPTDHTHALQNPGLLYSQSTNGQRATHTPDLSAVFISDVGSLERVRDTCKILGLPHMPLSQCTQMSPGPGL